VSTPQDAHDPDESGTTRRRFLTYLVAGPTLAVAAGYALQGGVAQAVVPTPPQLADSLDLGDVLILAAKDTESKLIIIEVSAAGKVTCALPRAEVGQGITTAVAMIIAEEMDVPLDLVTVTLADARPELMSGQLTGGSNSIRSVYTPTRNAAAAAKSRLTAAGAKKFGVPASSVRMVDGVVTAADGRTATLAELTALAADPTLVVQKAALKDPATFTVVGTPHNRKDARAMVTGALKYTNDLEPRPGCARAMVRRPPTIKGTAPVISNLAKVLKMPGIRKVVIIQTGVAVLADTFGQALDGKEALEVTWGPGSVDHESNATILQKLKDSQLPLAVPAIGTVIDAEFDFAPVSHAAMETNTAIADVRADGGTVWSSMKSPIEAGAEIEKELGLPTGSMTMHVTQGGGSFGRRLFYDGALEAARISHAAGVPVKLMWTRIDDMRHGRTRGSSAHQIRAVYQGQNVLSFEHRVAAVENDLTHGLGDAITAAAAQSQGLPLGNMGYSQTVFTTTVKSPYNFGLTTQVLNEVNMDLNTASWRSVYSAPTRGSEEIVVDELAAAMGKDPLAFRREFLADARYLTVLNKVAELGTWGKAMPKGTAQGLAFHAEYKSCTACLVELDARDRQNPRVTRATIVGDYGRAINPRGLQSQLLGGLTDAIATVFKAGLHIVDGLPLEGSYSQFHFPRQKSIPPKVEIFIMPPTTGEPGGAGELGLPAAVGAICNAWARATGLKPRSFPLIFPVDFKPFPKNSGSTRVQSR
jgi:isoquinoline 1-oxidoreductase beta subunit